MGLDMYFYATNAELQNDVIDTVALDSNHFDGLYNTGEAGDLYYMRKENAVHGFIADDYLENGGCNRDFNSVYYDVTHLIEPLKQACKNKKLEPRAGFFFGSTDPEDIDYDDIMQFLAKAEQEAKQGNRIIYTAWY